MNELVICIAATDQIVIPRWQSAFKNEGWIAKVFNSLCGLCSRTCLGELALVEVCSPLCKDPEDLQKIIKSRKPVATLAFASQQAISDAQIVSFLSAGADDFLFTNMDERVLVAKLKAYIRRLAPAISDAKAKVTSGSGDIRVDRNRRLVEIKAGPGKAPQMLELTQKELEILYILVGNERQVVSRESMLETLWGNDSTEVYSNCINKHIETLRKKLGVHGRRIKTVYGSGYMFT